MRRLSLLAALGLIVGTGGLSACDSAGTGGVYSPGTITAGSGGESGGGTAGGAAGKGQGGGASGGVHQGGTGGLSAGAGGLGAAGHGAAGAGPGGGEPGGGGMGGNGGSGGSEPACEKGAITCDGTTQKTCNGQGGYDTTTCPQACVDGVGCVMCQPGTGTCNGTMASQCRSDGSGYDQTVCDPELGLTCTDGVGTCAGACAKQSLQRSYIGCEYFPTVTSNSLLYSGFHFAIAVGNTTATEAKVTVKRGDMVVATDTVPPNSLKTIELPWIDALKGSQSGFASTLQAQGSYHVKTTQPVTVYQFNPLEFSIPDPGDCPNAAQFGACNSFTNDASLLLPINALGTDYVVAAAPTFVVGSDSGFGSVDYSQAPGLVAITATDDATMVTLTSKANVRTGTGVPAVAAGGTQTFALNRGDVLQLLSADVPQNELQCKSDGNGRSFCKVPAAYDLSGSFLSANKPIQVIGGHDCTFMPYNAFACDHIEESMFPLNTLGTEVIVTAPQSVIGAASNDGQPDKHTIRVISAIDGNSISLDPPIAPGGTLNKGQYADLQLTDKDVVIKGTGGLLVAQYMLGGDFEDPNSSGSPNSKGDPSLSLGIPSAQYRKSYTFLAPATYTYNFVNIVAKQGSVVKLDGQPLTIGGTAIGASGYAVLRQKVSGGAHAIDADTPFGIVVYGYGAYTSYMYPGGLNLSKL
jgi:hypothetical protein